MIIRYPWKSQKFFRPICSVPVAFDGVQTRVRPLFLMSNFCQQPACLRNGTGFVAPEFVDSDDPRHQVPPTPGTFGAELVQVCNA